MDAAEATGKLEDPYTKEIIEYNKPDWRYYGKTSINGKPLEFLTTKEKALGGGMRQTGFVLCIFYVFVRCIIEYCK